MESTKKQEGCCVVVCETPLDKKYWDAQYQANSTGWDLGKVSPPIKAYIDTIQQKDQRILIPGAGNAYEADYLLKNGFTNITIIDIAPSLTQKLEEKYQNNTEIHIITGDFFEHQGSYDLIIEQTFFCALPPKLRPHYTAKMHQLLSENGILAGLLFNRDFEVSPPFGGNISEYENLFKGVFHFKVFEKCTNSVEPRKNSELFFEFKKNKEVLTNMYVFEGITCSGCMNTVTQKFLKLPAVINSVMSTDFSQVLIVSSSEIQLDILQKEVAYDEKYKILPLM
jgi:methyl halide transferase